jgi:hypothetical protein
MTVRLASCRELSEDKEAIAQLAKSYLEVEENATPLTVLVPWFPGSAKRAKIKATKTLYKIFLSFIELRRNASVPNNDPIDLFISQGLSDDKIIAVRPSWLRSVTILI